MLFASPSNKYMSTMVINAEFTALKAEKIHENLPSMNMSKHMLGKVQLLIKCFFDAEQYETIV